MDKVTKNDLSFDEAKLDFEALWKTAAHALQLSADRVRYYEGKICGPLGSPDNSFTLNAQWLAEEANQLAVIADTLDTINGVRVRHRLKIINRPKIQPEEKEGE